MTVIADAKKRVTLQSAKPGDRFEVEISGDGKLVLTPLSSQTQKGSIKLVKKHGYTVAVGGHPITQEQVRKLLDEFP